MEILSSINNLDRTWILNNGTRTNQIATVGDLLKISGVKVTGTYQPNQCVKYSDIVATSTEPKTTTYTASIFNGKMAYYKNGNGDISSTGVFQSEIIGVEGTVISYDIIINNTEFDVMPLTITCYSNKDLTLDKTVFKLKVKDPGDPSEPAS